MARDSEASVSNMGPFDEIDMGDEVHDLSVISDDAKQIQKFDPPITSDDEHQIAPRLSKISE